MTQSHPIAAHEERAVVQEREPHPPRSPEASASATPPGWTYNPSSKRQRAPIVALALVNCAIATYLAVCQITGIHAWDPFFGDGTMRVLHSQVSRAFPVSDAALGAAAYLLEAISCLTGGADRWRSKPWLVIVFGILVVPLSVTSMALLMLQPIVVGSWCTLCLVAAALMLLMVVLSLDEVVAVIQFLQRCVQENKPFLDTLLEGERTLRQDDEADSASPLRGVTLPWNLLVSAAIGVWLLIAPPVVGMFGEAAISFYVAGAATLAVSVIACAEVARAVRYLNLFAGLWLLSFAPWSMVGETPTVKIWDVFLGAALLFLILPRGKVTEHYQGWNRFIV